MKNQSDWQDIMLMILGATLVIVTLLHSLNQHEQIKKLTQDYNSCKFYQEYAIDTILTN